MNKTDILSGWASCELTKGATRDVLETVQIQLGLHLPQEYVKIMERSNGIEGFVSANAYLSLWPVDKIVDLNEAYATAEFIPGLLLIGSNGGDTGYAIDTRSESKCLVEVPLVGMSQETCKVVAQGIGELVDRLRSA